ncbi:hypothetical protein BDB00DRAFT_878915 [Zychaea mexicana]|uniref:uncharacterized protein n=1 Tax=Zychaea mexicana TaxID=64656 RepID=UPI0022FEAAB0|nr:uncharacterized protein BDB00DRAFT_878915 [Zychaea mexicana]KAI9484386.1 hypothetical protein BDB00DRAFT_878915 [Zychaea mexicana]
MHKTLGHRHSFPPPSRPFSIQQDSLIASPPSPVPADDSSVGDGDGGDDGNSITAAAVAAAAFLDDDVDAGDAPTDAAVATTPAVDPRCTSTTTTPPLRLSEIERMPASHNPRTLPATAVATDHVTTTTTTAAAAAAASPTDQRQQQQQQEQRIEPFVSPLTETNLKYHTESFPANQEARQFYIESYVETQANVVQLENKLQRRRRAEIRSLVPLDTLSTYDELIAQHSVIQPHQQQQTTVTETTAAADSSNDNNTHHKQQKKKRRKWFNWLTPVRFKRKQEDQEYQQQQGPAATASINPATAPTTTLVDTTIADDEKNTYYEGRQRHRPSSSTTTATATSARQLQRNSWAAPETKYQHYQNEKSELLHDGLCVLNNVNILRALGGDRIIAAASASAGTGGGTGTGGRPNTTSMILLPSQQRRHLHHQGVKRDSSVSFPARQHQQSNKTNRRRFSARLRSVREDVQEQEQQQKQQLRRWNTSNDGISSTTATTLIGFRYPRMVHRHTLRDAAIQVLSSELSLWENEDQLNNNGEDDDGDYDDYDEDEDNIDYQQHHHHCHERGGLARRNSLNNETSSSRNSMSHTHRYYQSRNRRFSDPRMVFVS